MAKKRQMVIILMAIYVMGVIFAAPVTASTISVSTDYSENFVNIGTTGQMAPAAFQNTDSIDGTNKIYSQPVTGVFGRAVGDQSHRMYSDSTVAVGLNPQIHILPETAVTSGDKIKFSISFATGDKTNRYKGLLVMVNNTYLRGNYAIEFRPDGYIYSYGARLCLYDINTWYDFDLVFSAGTKRYDMYIDGTLVLTNSTVISSNITSLQARYEFKTLANKVTDLYADDCSITSAFTQYNSQDMTDNISSSLMHIAHNTNNVIFYKQNTTVGEFIDSVVRPEGMLVEAFQSDGTTPVSSEAIITLGMKFKITSPSGNMKKFLTVVDSLFSNGFGSITTNAVPAGFDDLGYETAGVRMFEGENGVGLKDINDQSARFSCIEATDKGLYLEKIFSGTGKTIIEYNVLKKDLNGIAMINFDIDGNYTGSGFNLPMFTDTGKITPSSEPDAGYSYELNRWYRIAIVMNLGTNTYDYYVNGEKLYDDKVGKATAINTIGRMRFTTKLTKAGTTSIVYLDDIKITETNDEYQPSLAEINSSAYYINNSNEAVYLNGIAVNGNIFVSNLNITSGSVIGVYNSDLSQKITSDNVKAGDVLVLLAPDNATYSYYNICDGPEYSDIQLYNGTISDENKIQSLASGNISAKLDIKYFDNTTPFSGTLLCALYDQDRLVNIAMIDKTLALAPGNLFAQDSLITPAIPVSKVTRSMSMKVFLWDGVSTMKPYISTPKIFDGNVGDIIIDVTSTYYKETGQWSYTSILDVDGRSARYTFDNGSVSCEWRPNIIEEGNYTVYVYKAVDPWNCPNANFDVFHTGGTDTKIVDYSTGSAMWVNLGTYYFGKGTDGYVKLSGNNSGTNLRAGTVKFVYAD